MNFFERKKKEPVPESPHTAEARKAILEGHAMPTPRFAIEEGGEILDKLRGALSTMSDEERSKFANGVRDFCFDLNNEKELSEKSRSWLEKNEGAQFFIGWLVIGPIIESTTGIPFSALTGIAVPPAVAHIIGRAGRKEREEIARKATAAWQLYSKTERL